MKQYFITINETQPKNKLDQALQGSFGIFTHKLINEPDIYLLKQIYQEVLDGYKANKGKCDAAYSESNYGTIFINIGDSLTLNLIPVTGTIKNPKR
jgi:hypothetical protein